MFARRLFFLLFAFVGLSMLAACSAEPQVVEVTRVVEVANEVEVPVTRVVEIETEVTREVEVEVTRLVEVETVVTATPAPTAEAVETATEDNEENDSESVPDEDTNEEPLDIFAVNFLGEVEKDGIKVEFARFLVTQRDAMKPDLDFDNNPMLAEHEYYGEVLWRITNSNDYPIRWFLQDINVRVNGRQIALEDWIRNGYIGTSLGDDIFSGSSIVGGVWFGLNDISPNDVEDVALLLGRPINSDETSRASGSFVVEGNLPEIKGWVDFPQELR